MLRRELSLAQRRLLGLARAAARGASRGLASLRLSRQAARFAGGLLLFLGLVMVGNAVATVVWQDPLTAFTARKEQKALGRELAAVERAPLQLARSQSTKSKRQRLAELAGGLSRRTAPGHPLGRIAIPKIGTSFVFVAGTGERSLEKGPGHYANTVLPGQRGSVGIAGHRTTFLAPFRRLDRLRKGDQILLKMPYGRFSYSVEGSIVVSPANGTVLRQVHHDRLVLTTCTPPFSAAKRLVVTARLMSAKPRG